MPFTKPKLLFPISILFCLTFLTSLSAQVEVGLKFGYNSTNTIFERQFLEQEFPGFSVFKPIESKYSEVQTIHLGLVSNIKLKKNFGLDIEFFYIGKGSDFRFDSSANSNFSYLHLNNTLALPVLLNYEVLPKLKLLAGIESDFIFSRYWVQGIEYRSVRKWVTEEEYESYDNFDFLGVLGVQYAFGGRWAMDLRYARNLRIFEDIIAPFYMRTYMFSLHYIFGK